MGKGLIKRSLAGVLMGGIMLGCMLNPISFSIMMCFAIVVMMHEYYTMTIGVGRYPVERILVSLFVVSAFLLTMAVYCLNLPCKYLLLLFIPFVAVLVTLLFDPMEQTDAGRKMEYVIFPAFYVGIPAVFTAMLMFPEGQYTWKYFISAFILIWMNDIGAYVLGMGFGQKPDSRKLYPSVSPKKSWVGVFGGLAFTIIAAVLIHIFGFLHIGLLHGIIIAMLVTLFGVFGDLFESLIKRRCGFKDSGMIMPGHGGLLDRFDGALFVIPVVVIYVNFLVLG